jgi:F-type H+-transporting ATPase subunit alpha
VEEQVIAIYAGVRGYLDTIEMRDVGRFEQGVLAEIRAKGTDLLATIRDEREISKDTEEKLKTFFDGYAKTFA